MDVFEKRRQELKISTSTSNNPEVDIFEKRRRQLEDNSAKERKQSLIGGQAAIKKEQNLVNTLNLKANVIPKNFLPAAPQNNFDFVPQSMKNNQSLMNVKTNPVINPTVTKNNDLPYVKTLKEVPKNFKSGNVAGGIGNSLKGAGQMVLEGLQAPQKLVLNASKNILDLSKGKKPSFDANISTDSYLKDTGNADTEKFYKTTGGQIASTVLGVASDPLTWIGGGLASDAIKAAETGTKGVINAAKTGEKVSKKVLPYVDNLATNFKPVNDLLSQPNKSNVIAPSLSKELPNVSNKNVATNIDNGSSMLNVPVKKGGFADNVIAETKPKLKNERGFSNNVRTDTAMNEDVRKVFDENPLTYEPLSNKATLAKADEKMSKGFTSAYADWNKNINNFDPSDIPLARKLANEAAQSGDMETARRIISDVSEKLTQSGQYSQAASILRKADPATFNGFMDNQLKKLNEDGRKMYGKKWSDYSLTDDETKQLYSKDIIDEDSREKLMESIYDRISQTMPSSKMEKFDAWRRTAMLLNPKTHIRNVVGNGIMGIMRKSADTLGAGIEKVFLKEGQRTKSFGWSVDSELKSTVDNVWTSESKNLTSSNRYDINNLKFMNRDKRIFKSKAMNAVDNFTKGTLNLEDKIFLERAYKDALGGYMKSNGMKVATQAAKDYAKRRSFEATFKQANFLSDTINKAKKVKVLGKFVEGAIPFTQTPANIMMRGVEYSPLGIIKGLFGAASKNTGAQIIEDFSKGLTGTAALGVGYTLASMGAAKWQRSKSDTVAGLESEVGEQSSSITTPWGSYTFDWAQPASIPLAMGISFYEGLQKKDASKAEALLNAIYAGGDTIVNMTMLKNIKDIMGGGGSVTQKIMSIPVSYIEQAIPSLSGQIAKTIDTTKRSTYDPNPFKSELNKIQAKIPGLSKSLNADRDIFGQTQNTGGWFQQFISPGYVKGKSTDPVSNELVRLYKANKETDFLPKYLSGSFSLNNVDYKLSADELEKMRKEVGQSTLNEMKLITNGSNYKLATDEIKMKQLSSVVNKIYNRYKNNYAKSKSTK